MENWQKQFVRSLFHYSTERMHIDKAFMVKHEHVPSRLYKYRRFTENHLKALSDNVLYLSSPDRLNDPFEAQVKFDVDRFIVEDQSAEEFISASKEAIHAISAGEAWRPAEPLRPIEAGVWRKKLQQQLVGNSDVPHKAELIDVLDELMRQQAVGHVQAMSNSLRSGLSVLSFSATSTSKLLWSHYSDSHTGFVIEYDFQSLPFNDLRRRLCFPVFYTGKLRDATRYLAKPHRPFNNLFGQYMCLIKQDTWAYEEEWRIVQAIGPEHANFEMRMPEPIAVILGSQVSSANEETMVQFCQQRSIGLKRMVQTPGTFELTPQVVPL